MEQPTIYHNPRCSKSRATLALLQEQGFEPEVVEYLQTPPSSDTLRSLCRLLGLPLAELVRTGEAVYGELQLADSDEQTLLAAMGQHPILLQRPIVRLGERAVIGRPPENVLTLLPKKP